MSFFVEAVDQPIKLDEKKSAIAVVELQVKSCIDCYNIWIGLLHDRLIDT